MPTYTLKFTATMPGAQGPPQVFRTKVTANSPAEAKVKLHRFVQEKIVTGIEACEEEKPAAILHEALEDIAEMTDILTRIDRLKRKHNFPKK